MSKIFKLDQKGIISLIPLFLLLAGIIAGVYLVIEGPKIFKPKASEMNTTTPPISEDYPLDTTIGGFVFEDMNGNGMWDVNEVGIPKVKVTVMERGSGLEGYELDHPISEGDRITDENGYWYMHLGNPWMSKDYSECREQPCIWAELEVPGYGWEVIGDDKKALPLASNGRLKSIRDKDKLDSEIIKFSLRGTLNINGQTFYDDNKNGIQDQSERATNNVNVTILVDGSQADNVGSKVHFDYNKIDGSFQINNLPPFSLFKVKASAACPWLVTTPAVSSDVPLGPQNQIGYNFGVVFDESCISR